MKPDRLWIVICFVFGAASLLPARWGPYGKGPPMSARGRVLYAVSFVSFGLSVKVPSNAPIMIAYVTLCVVLLALLVTTYFRDAKNAKSRLP